MELEHGQLARWSVTARLCPGILPQFLLQGCRAEKATLNLEVVLVCYRPWDKLSSFFLPADHRILVEGATLALITLILHSLWRDGQNLCGCRGLTPPPAPGWCGIRAGRCGSPDAVPEPHGEQSPWRDRSVSLCQAPGCQDWTRGKHQAGLASHLLGVGLGRAGMPTPSCATCMASFLQSVFSRFFKSWEKCSLSRGTRQGTTQPVQQLLSMLFLFPWREIAQHRAPVHVQDVLTGAITHLLPTVSSQQLCGNAGFSSCCALLSSLSAGPNLSPLYLYANSTVISIP